MSDSCPPARARQVFLLCTESISKGLLSISISTFREQIEERSPEKNEISTAPD